MVELDRVESRLENIRSVQPILSALHSVSLGSWRMALNRGAHVQRYREWLAALLPPLIAHLPPPAPSGHSPRILRLRSGQARGGRGGSIVVLVIGSERGLCGRFSAAVVKRAEAYLAERRTGVELMALGSRVRRILERRGHRLAWSSTLSATALPSPNLASALTCHWLARYEAHELDAADLIYNTYHGLGSHEPTVTRLIPPVLPLFPPLGGEEIPIIVETDPLNLLARVVEMLTTIHLYELLLESAMAEHAARYSLMEAATKNTEALITDLTLAVQTARQRAVTREVQELAAGAGLIGPRDR